MFSVMDQMVLTVVVVTGHCCSSQASLASATPQVWMKEKVSQTYTDMQLYLPLC